MKFSNPGRPAKGQLKCNHCKTATLPKNGDWFVSKVSQDQQVFLCKKCESETKADYSRTVPVK